jgi:hypothetical protein
MELTTVGYDGRVFRPTGGAGGPVGRGGATGRYFQRGDLVWAEFSGGPVRSGRLVGRCRPDGTIDAAYAQVMADGEVVAGSCVSTPTALPDGRLRLTERWRRIGGQSGVSEIEEVNQR